MAIFFPILTALVLFLLVSLGLFIRKNNHKTSTSCSNLPPGSLGWPILGETLAALRAARSGSPETFIRERVEKHGSPPVFKTSLHGEPMAVLCGPAGNKFLFGNENTVVGIWWPSSMRRLIGSSLLTIIGEEAKCMRKILSPFLSPDAFTRLYMTKIDMITHQHIQTHWQGKKVIQAYQTIKLYTFELACRLFMSLEDPKHIAMLAAQFDIFLKGFVGITLNFPGTRFNRAMRAVTTIKKELLMIVRQRKVELEQRTASPSQDLLSHLLVSCNENGRFLTEAEIINNILVLLLAGRDTSASAITSLMKILGELPQVYAEVLREQMDITASKQPGELLQWEDIQKMRYSWNVASEVMRLWPPVYGGFREALVDFTYAGYTIPKGWKLFWSAGSTQRDEDFFPNTTNFDASRFERAVPTPFSYVPFGGGPRMCLGKEFARLEILIFLHNVVKRFKWDLLFPDEKITYFPVPAPIKGLPILLQPHQL